MSCSNSLRLNYCATYPTKIESYFHHRYFMDHTQISPTFTEYVENFGLTYLLRHQVEKRNQTPIFTSTKNSEILWVQTN